MCKIFHAFSFWIEDANLHQPSLCFSAYGPKYCCERLKLIYNNDQKDWIDLVSIAQLKDELEQKVHSWVHKKYSFCNVHSVEFNEESVEEPISRHFNSNKDIKPLSCIFDIDPPMREIEDIALSSWNVLVDLIESKQSVIFDKARCFTDLSSTLKQLNSNYKKLVPEEFVNENYEEINEKACHRGFKCAGPAKFKLQLERYISNQRICQKIESNRIEYSMIQDRLLNLPNTELCIASIHIENYFSALSNKTAQAKGEEALQLKKLGVFILNQEDQLCSLTEAILKYPEAGELAFGVFNPNIDLKYILKGANFGDRRKLFKFVTETLLQYGSNPSEEQQIVHGVLRDHFRIILLWEFPEFYDDCISFILKV
ncbi:ectopic P granules protein 5 [Caerostris extrusa]|uniref:Ectopic P granules protein 5 n=1 Tax=Caerostris extrusa TaxID=172846 RepID=A0AAV4S5J8_CAEEX|nr:ectopic P granules protein 5 [Caerostris extrusa]